jgi:hypothetical protein
LCDSEKPKDGGMLFESEFGAYSEPGFEGHGIGKAIWYFANAR